MKTMIVNFLFWMNKSRNNYLIRVIEALFPFKSLTKKINSLYDFYSKWFYANVDYILDWRNDFNTSFSKYAPHWRTYFDWSEGKIISSKEQALDIQRRTGRERVTIADWKVESAKQQRYKEQEHENIIAKRVALVARDVANGRKFTQESKAHREKIMKQYGMTRLPNA
jgi:hypothetical protein